MRVLLPTDRRIFWRVPQFAEIRSIVGLGHLILKTGVITYDLFLYVFWNFSGIFRNYY